MIIMFVVSDSKGTLTFATIITLLLLPVFTIGGHGDELPDGGPSTPTIFLCNSHDVRCSCESAVDVWGAVITPPFSDRYLLVP